MLMFSCHSSLDKESLLAYLKKEENGLLQKKSIKGIDFTVMYQPSQLMAYRESSTAVDLNKYDEYLYFILSLSANGEEILNQMGNHARFSEMVSQLSFGMGEKIRLVTSTGNEIPLLDVHHARTYGMAGANQLMLIFKRDETGEAEWIKLQLQDFGLNTGDVSFKFNINDLKKIPELNT